VIKQKECRVTLGSLVAAFALAMISNAEGWAATGTPASSAPTSPLSRLPEVTVTAQRLKLEQRVSKFVEQIAATENGAEGIARWQVPAVCPLVSGLPQKDGEFILERLSEIARMAGVPLADKENCRPNLYVLVTDQPEELLRGMEQRNRGYTFGYDASTDPPTETPAAVVDEFIKTPRPVRVWYNSTEKDIWGNPVAYCPASDVLPRLYDSKTVMFIRCSRGIAGGSHIVLSAIWAISSAFVIVDRHRLREVTLGQLADYVAMASFAKLKPGARLEDAPTILKLFDGTPQAAPAGMTEWDQTFLKSLYSTEQTLKMQRGQIARSMVREIAP
jgi:hypothetical protein